MFALYKITNLYIFLFKSQQRQLLVKETFLGQPGSLVFLWVAHPEVWWEPGAELHSYCAHVVGVPACSQHCHYLLWKAISLHKENICSVEEKLTMRRNHAKQVSKPRQWIYWKYSIKVGPRLRHFVPVWAVSLADEKSHSVPGLLW